MEQRAPTRTRASRVAGYPNLFFTFGPNSGPGHNSALVYMEAQIDYLADAIGMILTQNLRTLEVRQDEQDRYNEQHPAASDERRRGIPAAAVGISPRTASTRRCSPASRTQYVRQLADVDPDDFLFTPADAESVIGTSDHAVVPLG